MYCTLGKGIGRVCGGGGGIYSTSCYLGTGGGDKLGSGKNSKKRVKNRLLGHGVTMLARVKPHLEVWGSEKGG